MACFVSSSAYESIESRQNTDSRASCSGGGDVGALPRILLSGIRGRTGRPASLGRAFSYCEMTVAVSGLARSHSVSNTLWIDAAGAADLGRVNVQLISPEDFSPSFVRFDEPMVM